jgi:hypothetical protein
MNAMGISQKLIRLTEMKMKGTKAVVKINNQKANPLNLIQV